MAAAVNVAHATVIDSETETLQGTGPGDTILVTSTVSTTTGGYTYDYSLSVPAGGSTETGVDAYTVYSWSSLAGLGIADLNATSPFSGGVNTTHVSWSDGLVDEPLTLDFNFFSPDAPTQGYSAALDDATYNATAGAVYVPTLPAVPDGGLTMTLLGGSLLGLGALRRKLGC